MARLVLLLGIAVLAGCLGGSDVAEDANSEPLPTDLAWRELAPIPTSRAEHAAAVLDGRIYVIGGFELANNVDGVATGLWPLPPTASVEVYEIASDTWSDGPDYPEPLDHAVSVGHEGFVYVFWRGDPYKLDVATMEWSRIADLPTGRDPATGAVDPATGLVYLAGWGSQGEPGHLTRYDPRTDSYERLADYPIPRNHAASAFGDTRFYIGNGDIDGHAVNTAHAASYDPATRAWTELAPNPVARGSVAGTEWYGRFVVLGGQNQSMDLGERDVVGWGQPARADAHAYDPATDAWTELPSMPHGRHGFAAVTWDGRIYAIAGAPQEGVSGFPDVTVLRAG